MENIFVSKHVNSDANQEWQGNDLATTVHQTTVLM